MTRAKRYEGERLRAWQWHNMGRDKAWERKRAGARELAAIILDKFELYCETKYDPMECGYLIVTEVSVRQENKIPGIRIRRPGELIFAHEEPALEFPSDHLKTKLLMIAG